MEERDGFFFFRSFYDSISLLPDADQLAMYRAIACYSLDGKQPEGLSNTQSAFWLLMKPVLEKSVKRAASGKKGGSKTQANVKQNASKTQANVKQTDAPGENVGVCDGFASDLLSVCSYSDSESDKGLGTRDKGLGIKDEGQGIKDKGFGDTLPGGSLFSEFWNAYPQGARLDRKGAYSAWREQGLTTSEKSARELLSTLDAWKRSDQWADAGGRYIPKPENFIRNYAGSRPSSRRKAVQPSGVLGEAEKEAIRRMLEAE